MLEAAGVDLAERGPLGLVGDDDEGPLLPVRPGRRLLRDADALPDHLERHGPLEIEALADCSRRRQQLVGIEVEEGAHRRDSRARPRSTTVRAMPEEATPWPDHNVRAARIREWLNTGLWFLPMLWAFGAMAAAVALGGARSGDRRRRTELARVRPGRGQRPAGADRHRRFDDHLHRHGVLDHDRRPAAREHPVLAPCAAHLPARPRHPTLLRDLRCDRAVFADGAP